MVSVPSRKLLVEGKQECLVIPYLMEANGVQWGARNNPIVSIHDCDGFNNLVNQDVIYTEIQASGLISLGIIIDADDNPIGRWQSIRNACLFSIPDLPVKLPETGLIHIAPNNVRFGIWMMPDNQMRGMLETFLAYLLPEGCEELWIFAQQVAQESKIKGATFSESHIDKANIYTWLSWQDPPGRQLHQAIIECILEPNSPYAQNFVNWFKTLYALNPDA